MAKPSCVGQSDRVMESLRQHLRDERYWSHAVVFVKGDWSKTTRARLAGRLGAVTKHPKHTPEKIERLAPEEDVKTIVSAV